MCVYEIKENPFNYYHYEPGSNIIIVYCKHITPPSPFRLSLFDGELAPNRDAINGPFRRVTGDQWLVHSNTLAQSTRFREFLVFFTYKKLLGRTETRTCERMCFQSIRTVSDISRDEQELRPAVCKQQENYSMDTSNV